VPFGGPVTRQLRLLKIKNLIADERGVGWTLMPVDHQYEAFLRYKEKYEPDSVMVWSVDAETEEEAHTRYREYMYGESAESTNGE
jgi:hypothetical protein